MASAQGEDRSAYQKVLPPTGANGRKLDFVIFKATEGVNYVDPHYADNVALARRGGVPFGSYHFFHPSLSVAEQVKLFTDTVSAQGALVPGAILVEDSELAVGIDDRLVMFRDRSQLLVPDASGFAHIRDREAYPHHLLLRGTPTSLTTGQVDLATASFLIDLREDVIKRLGGDHCQEMLYTFRAMLSQLPSCIDFPLWVADFTNEAPTSVAPWKDWTIWQYAGGGGNDNSDKDAYNGDVEAFTAWLHAKEKPPQPPTPTPPSPVTFEVSLPQLQVGDTDPLNGVMHVRRLQWLLAGLSQVANIQAARGLVSSGIFGPETQLAVKDMQVFAKLATDLSTASGKVGKAEWQFLIAGVRGTA